MVLLKIRTSTFDNSSNWLRRRDAVGHISCTECNSSETAPLARNQKLAYPEIEESGAIVVGKAEQGEHLQLLQDMRNTYVAFIESGEIYTEIPDALDKQPIDRINGFYEL
ncbi:DUF6572 domain-containing protein [Pseudomonas kitaguniensis]|uniref:DUF6572 domain-containing protein n=1 Tax=Pseudomonas kitaguniensis TaxID=2607908 RepID=UPI003D04D59F